MKTLEPSWYVVEAKKGRIVRIREGPYNKKEEAEKAAAESGKRKSKVLYWDGKSWQML